jgi:hypothetical protein
MYNGTIIEVFISSPSDVTSERKLIYNLIEEWNIINTKRRKQILRPISWEKDVFSSFGESTQSIINAQILNDADLLIGIFNARIGTPTKEYSSGSVEEIIKHIENNKPAMLFFSNENIDRKNFNIDQYNKLNEFKDWCKEKSVYFEYSNIDEFRDIIRTQLGLMVNNNDYFSISTNELNNNSQQYQKTSQKQKDIIHFLSHLSEFKDNKRLSDFISQIGSFRFNRILPALKNLDILNAEQTLDGTYQIVILHGFHGFSETEIKNIIYSIENGEIDI